MSATGVIQKNFYFLARRFVAGETIDSAIAAVRALNEAGMSATLDFLGEDVLERPAALHTRDVYIEMLDAIRARGVDSNVSVKLTAMGLLLDEDFAFENLRAVVEHARAMPTRSCASIWKVLRWSPGRCASSSVFCRAQERRHRSPSLPEAHRRRRAPSDRAGRARSPLQGRL